MKKILPGPAALPVEIIPVLPWLTDVPALFKALAGKTARISFESYNPRLGSWPELRPQLSPEIRVKLEAVYASEISYQQYWQSFVEQVKHWNTDYQFNLNFFFTHTTPIIIRSRLIHPGNIQYC